MLFSQIKSILSSIFLLVIILLAAIYFIDTSLAADSSPDAIALRIIPNPVHHSAADWYAGKGFAGSPQAVVVDGYEGVRDGRTAYVNAANVDSGDLYTNIYVISYNQDAENETVDIFGQILEHWNFNANLATSGFCGTATATDCLIDQDCTGSGFCDSLKAKVVRDTRRLADISGIKALLDSYKTSKSYYPKLSAGSYLANQTISVWPSWQKVLAQELKGALPVDPVNRLGDCGSADYNPITCWDEKAKAFAGTIPGGLPIDSYAYAYKTDSGGKNISLCAQMETAYPAAVAFSCAPVSLLNQPPQITSANFPAAICGQPYTATVQASDPDGDPLVWSLELVSGSTWDKWLGGPGLKDTASANTKNVYAQSAGSAGTNQLKVSVDDGSKNGKVTKEYSVASTNPHNPAVSPVSNQTAVSGADFSLVISGADADGHYPLSFGATGLPNGLQSTMVSDRDYKIYGRVNDLPKTYSVTVSATDSCGGVSNAVNFTISYGNQPPVITSSPATSTQVNSTYTYQVIAQDPEGQRITGYSAEGLPKGITIDSATGLISGKTSELGVFNITAKAKDEYGAEGSQAYTLSVVTSITDFNVNPIPDSNAYLCSEPECPPVGKMYYPVTFFTTATVNPSVPVTWKLSGNPYWLTIHPSTGEIQGTPTNKSEANVTYLITVIADNGLGSQKQTIFKLTVKENAWCGDNNAQTLFGEACDLGVLNGMSGSGCTNECISEAIACGSPMTMQNCTPIPANASYNTVDKVMTGWDSTCTIFWDNISHYDTSPTLLECHFICDTGYSYDSINNQCVLTPITCCVFDTSLIDNCDYCP